MLRAALLCTLFLGLIVTALPAQAAAQESDQQAAICVVGDVYNTGSRPCAGLVCYGQSQYAWQNCVTFNPPCTVVHCKLAASSLN